MVTAEFIQRAQDAIKDPEGQRIKGKVVAEAQNALVAKLPKRDPDKDFLDVARKTLLRFQTLAMAWFFDSNDPRSPYVQRIKDELAVICGFYDWNPGHFLDAAEMTHAVAIAYDWFYDHLTPTEKELCIQAIMEKGLRRGYEQLVGMPKPAAWPTQSTNWNIVCNAGLMIGALAIVRDVPDPLPETVFQRCLESVPTGFHSYSPDGGWDEGPGYWAYATEYAAYLLSSLNTALRTEYGLADLPGFYESGHFRMHAEGGAPTESNRQRRRFFNFSDCDEERRGSWCMRWLSWRFEEPRFNWMAHKDGQARAMDLFWYMPMQQNSTKGLELNKVFKGRANVAMLRGAWATKAGTGFRPWLPEATEDEVFLGIRAGHNSRENSHGHLDLGSFVLDAQQVRWATDLPPVDGDYSLPGYFDVDHGRRFRYYRTSTVGHNTLVVNGFNQLLGIETEIVAFSAKSPGLAVVVLDLTPAYPDCLRVRRGFALIDQQHVLIVDELTPKKELTVAWQMHTKHLQPTAPGGQMVRLEHNDGKGVKEFFVRILGPTEPSVEFTNQAAAGTQPGEAPSADVRKLVATMNNVVSPIRIAVYLSPLREPIAKLPVPLNGPLWSWIDWAGPASVILES